MPFPFQAAKAKKDARAKRRLEKRVETAQLAKIGGIPGPETGQGEARTSNLCSDTRKRATVKIERFKAKRAKKKKSPSLSKLKKKLWLAMREVVYAQSPVCVVCKSDAPPVACHIVPSNEGAATRFFLPNVYRGCQNCNGLEKWNRGKWAILVHPEIFGQDLTDALWEFSKTTFQLKKDWVLEQTARMERLLEAA